MSKDSRSPAWPNVPVSKCECVPAPLILILRALPFQAASVNLHTPLKPISLDGEAFCACELRQRCEQAGEMP